jgi:hypothetical protein
VDLWEVLPWEVVVLLENDWEVGEEEVAKLVVEAVERILVASSWHHRDQDRVIWALGACCALAVAYSSSIPAVVGSWKCHRDQQVASQAVES